MHNYPTKDCPGSSRFLSIFNIPDKFVLLLHNYATVVRLGLIDGAPLQTGETGKKKKFYGVRGNSRAQQRSVEPRAEKPCSTFCWAIGLVVGSSRVMHDLYRWHLTRGPQFIIHMCNIAHSSHLFNFWSLRKKRHSIDYRLSRYGIRGESPFDVYSASFVIAQLLPILYNVANNINFRAPARIACRFALAALQTKLHW